jgi:hypothetical protein
LYGVEPAEKKSLNEGVQMFGLKKKVEQTPPGILIKDPPSKAAPKAVDVKFDDSKAPLIVEKYKHVHLNLKLYWGTKDFHEYVMALVLTERAKRAGFPFEVLRELDLLIQDHDVKFPHFRPKETKWDINFLK